MGLIYAFANKFNLVSKRASVYDLHDPKHQRVMPEKTVVEEDDACHHV
jgi:hypothetical protein